MTDQELNEAVARKLGWTDSDYPVKGWLKRPRSEDPSSDNYIDVPPDYCHSIEAAWEIVDKLAKENEAKGCGPILDLSHDGLWHFRIGAMGETLGEGNVAQADTAPMAICKAFLKLEDRKETENEPSD